MPKEYIAVQQIKNDNDLISFCKFNADNFTKIVYYSVILCRKKFIKKILNEEVQFIFFY